VYVCAYERHTFTAEISINVQQCCLSARTSGHQIDRSQANLYTSASVRADGKIADKDGYNGGAAKWMQQHVGIGTVEETC
jgi:hypothetical protein